MKIYVAVTGAEYEPSQILGCYSTKEQADARLLAEKDKDRSEGEDVERSYYSVECHTLDS